MVTCNKGVLVEHDRVQEIPYRDIWVYFNCVDFFLGGGGVCMCISFQSARGLHTILMIIQLDMYLVL